MPPAQGRGLTTIPTPVSCPLRHGQMRKLTLSLSPLLPRNSENQKGFINKTTLRYSRILFCLETPTSSQLQTEPFQHLPCSHLYPLHYLTCFVNHDHGVETEISHPEAVKNIHLEGQTVGEREEGDMLHVLLCCSTLPNFMWSS